MKSLKEFDADFLTFVQEEARREAIAVRNEKDTSRPAFNLENLRKFTYKEQLDKYQRRNPLLLNVIIGTLSKEKVLDNDIDDIARKGFGGPATTSDISLVPTGKQLY